MSASKIELNPAAKAGSGNRLGRGADEAITIRRMTLADVKAAHALDVLSFSLPWPERSYRFEVAENPNAVPLVAETTAGQIAGMAVSWVIVDELHIATIAVHPDYRRQGVGRRLLTVSLLSGWERGARQAYLEVRRGNTAAQVLYQGFGFELVGERPRYYQDNHEDALLMTLAVIDPERLEALGPLGPQDLRPGTGNF